MDNVTADNEQMIHKMQSLAIQKRIVFLTAQRELYNMLKQEENTDPNDMQLARVRFEKALSESQKTITKLQETL